MEETGKIRIVTADLSSGGTVDWGRYYRVFRIHWFCSDYELKKLNFFKTRGKPLKMLGDLWDETVRMTI